MTPEFCCGFECGLISTTSGHFTLSGVGTAPTINTNASFVRNGARSLRCNPSANTSYANTPASFVSGTRHVVRFYVYFTTLPSADCNIAGFGAGAVFDGPNVRFKQSDSKIYAAVNTTLGASGVSVTTGQWYRIDYDFNVNTGGNDACDVKVDGTACGQASAAGASSTNLRDSIGILTSCSADAYFDDYISSSTAADYPIGAGYVNHFIPTSDGTHNIAGTGDFQRTLTGTDILNSTTDAYLLVDEVPLEATVTDWINLIAPPNATDYVECIFGPAPGIPVPVNPPRTVEVICGINQAGTGTGNMEIRLNDNGTTGVIYTATGVAGVAVASGQVFKRAHFADPPRAATAWTLSGNGNFNNVRIRFGSPAAVDANPDQYFGCAMIEAEFAPELDRSMYTRPFGVSGQAQMNQLLAT